MHPINNLCDCYLPSLAELELIYDNRALINTTAQANGGDALISSVYGSSKESSTYNAWRCNFNDENSITSAKSHTNHIRALWRF